jgi:predicted transport protein
MKNKQYFLNERRRELGKPPMIIRRNTPKQTEFIKRSSLIEYFKKAVNSKYNKNYFTHPSDIADIKKENAKISVQLKMFFDRCDKDIKKCQEVIDFFSDEYGKWCNWKPSICFRKDTVIDFENNIENKNNNGFENNEALKL